MGAKSLQGEGPGSIDDCNPLGVRNWVAPHAGDLLERPSRRARCDRSPPADPIDMEQLGSDPRS